MQDSDELVQGRYLRGRAAGTHCYQLLVIRSSCECLYRFVLAATEHLQTTLKKLEDRMHSLEDAIAIVYGADSDSPHPLLVKCKDEEVEEEPPNLQSTKEEAEEKDRDSPALLDALGTLYIDHDGWNRFFGPSGGSEVSIYRRSSEKLSDLYIFRAYLM